MRSSEGLSWAKIAANMFRTRTITAYFDLKAAQQDAVNAFSNRSLHQLRMIRRCDSHRDLETGIPPLHWEVSIHTVVRRGFLRFLREGAGPLPESTQVRVDTTLLGQDWGSLLFSEDGQLSHNFSLQFI